MRHHDDGSPRRRGDGGYITVLRRLRRRRSSKKEKAIAWLRRPCAAQAQRQTAWMTYQRDDATAADRTAYGTAERCSTVTTETHLHDNIAATTGASRDNPVKDQLEKNPMPCTFHTHIQPHQQQHKCKFRHKHIPRCYCRDEPFPPLLLYHA